SRLVGPGRLALVVDLPGDFAVADQICAIAAVLTPAAALLGDDLARLPAGGDLVAQCPGARRLIKCLCQDELFVAAALLRIEVDTEDQHRDGGSGRRQSAEQSNVHGYSFRTSRWRGRGRRGEGGGRCFAQTGEEIPIRRGGTGRRAVQDRGEA